MKLVIARSKATKQSRVGGTELDCFASLAMTSYLQCAISTGSLALARTWRVVPPKIIWRSRLWV